MTTGGSRLNIHQFELNGQVVDLLQLGNGQIRWKRHAVPGQPGDSTQVKSAPIEMHGGFGASHRVRRGNGSPTNPTHHAYGQNMTAMFEGLLYPSPRITYFDMSGLADISGGFRIGGYPNSVIGGSGVGIGAIGGGSFSDTPQYIREHNGQLWLSCGRYTFSVNPDLTLPAVTDVRDHGASSRARSSDVFGNALGVACGQAHVAEWLIGAMVPDIEAGEAGSQDFVYTGAPVTFDVPSGVTELVVDMKGGAGGGLGYVGVPAARGGRIQAKLAVTPGESLTINVAGKAYYDPGSPAAGSSPGAGGYNGGGDGDVNTNSFAGGGGGATDIRQGGSALANRVLVAGGGGGHGAPSGQPGGAGGGSIGGTGGTGVNGGVSGGGGGGGSQSSGGAFGDGVPNGDGQAGTLGEGGNGGSIGAGNANGGGGGGGYYGGGGGAGPVSSGSSAFGGGGGGSNYANPGVTTDVVHTQGYTLADGDGTLTLSWEAVAGVSGGGTSDWSPSEMYVDVYKTGTGGRLFAGAVNKVYNVLPGGDPLLSANYLPSNGETITDVSNPIRNLVEFASSLVAGTVRGPRALDPNRGYQDVPLTNDTRLSASEYDGRGMLSIGAQLFHGTTRGVTMIQPGRPPQEVGPPLLRYNDTPYKGMEWGIPDYLGEWMAWPGYIPETGDSVIFFARLRDPDDPGTGPVAWHDVLYLEGREARCVRMWGGSATRKPRLFFGAGTTNNPFQAGWIDLDSDGGPAPFTSAGQPARTGFMETPLDDLGLPGVPKSVERVEIPYLHGADENNYFIVSVRGGHDGDITPLIKSETGTQQSRINTEGFQRVFVPTDVPVLATEIGLRFEFVQTALAQAADWLMVHGVPMLYYTEVPAEVDVIETVVDAKTTQLNQAEERADEYRALMRTGPVRCRFGPSNNDQWVKVTAVNVTTVEVNNSDKSATRLGIELTMREVMTG